MFAFGSETQPSV